MLMLRNMRIALVAVPLLLASACVGEIADSGDDGTGSGSDTGSGSGSGSGSDEIQQARVSGTFDKATIATELAKTETLILSITSENGFAGDVTLGARLVDGTDTPATDVTVTGPTNITLAAGATEMATFEIKVPMSSLGAKFDGALKVDLMSAGATTTVSSAVTIEAVYTVDYLAGTSATANKHTNAGNLPNLAVKRGAVLRFKNSDLIDHVIHGDGAFENYHENTVSGGAAGRTYEIPTIAIPPGSSGALGCHNHGIATYSTYRVL